MISGRIRGGGIPVTFEVNTDIEENEWGVPENSGVPVTFDNCLVFPTSSASLTSSSGASLNDEGRDFVSQTKATVCLPKGSMEYLKDKTGADTLRGATCYLPNAELDKAEMYEVIGDPQPISERLCPTPWNLRVTLRRIEG
jgi:hypothetical protein